MPTSERTKVVSSRCLMLPFEFSFSSTASTPNPTWSDCQFRYPNTPTKPANNQYVCTDQKRGTLRHESSSVRGNVRYKHDGCSILSCPTSLPSSMPIIIGLGELEEGWESLDLRLYRTNELDLDNSSERTCFPLPPLARSPNLFLAFGQKTEASRCRLTRLLF